jgi:hypothetical protein
MARKEVPEEERFLEDPELFKLVDQLARKFFPKEADAEDGRNGSYEKAKVLIRTGTKPPKGYEHGWMWWVAKHHCEDVIKKRKSKKQVTIVDVGGDVPELPSEDQRELREQMEEAEVWFEALETAKAESPQRAKDAFTPDARTEDGEAKDPATRKRKERARSFLAERTRELVAAAVGAVLVGVFVLVRPKPAVPIVPTLRWDDTTLAAASRELAVKSCTAREWSACLAHLEDAKRRDPAKFGAGEESARAAAIAALRSDALRACGKQQWRECVQGLDGAKDYDAAGDREPLVQLARFEAGKHVASGSGAPPGLPDAKGPFPH